MTEHTAYVLFLSGVGLALGLLTIALVVIVYLLARQHRRSKPR